MSKIKEIIKNTDPVLYSQYLADKVFGNSHLETVMKEYAEYYAKIAVKNTRYKAIDIAQNVEYHDEVGDILNDIVRDIQNIDNNSVLPPHE